jgi:hypothetical protein
MCLTSISIYSDYWKSFMKFGIKKSHEMISHILAWIALLSEQEYVSSTKSCNFSQMILNELYNKSHEGFRLSKCQENTSIGPNLQIELSNDITLTKVEMLFRSKRWSLTKNKSWSLGWVQQMLFLDQVMIQPLSGSDSGHKTEENPDFRT